VNVRKLIAAASGLVLVSGIATASIAAAAPGEAVNAEAGTCAGQGTANLYADSAHTTPTTIAPGQPTSLQQGYFHFQGPGVCTVTAGDPSEIGTSGLTTLSSDGSYAGQLAGQLTPCGTGTANGTAQVTVAGETYTINYTITFVNGQGTLTINSGADSDGDVSSVVGGGSVTITPVPNTGCTLSAATGFSVVYTINLAAH
jgi:hypothetical protein